MQGETFYTTANIAGALAAITAALHSALQGTAPAAGMMAGGPPGTRWFIWPELTEQRESGERRGFYVWWGSIHGELEQPDPEDESLATVLWEGKVLHFELRYYQGMAPTVVKVWQSTEAAAGLYGHLVAQLGQWLPVAATVDQAPPAREVLQLEATTPAGEIEGSERQQRRSGARRLPCNIWARAEHAKGRTVDELLEEYTERYRTDRGEEPADPRGSLRKALQ